MKQFSHRGAIKKVLAYIDTHKDSDLDLNTLSKVAGISSFHFHRIFRAYMGISIGQYIKIKRLETGMWKLIYTKDHVLEIALDAGYENHASFTRAFTKEMGFSPTEFRKKFYENRAAALDQQQKNAPEFLGVQERQDTPIFYVRRKGSYFLSAGQAWDVLIDDLKMNQIPIDQQTYYGISQDDPNALEAAADSLRFDVCIKASEEVVQQAKNLKAEKGLITGGKYARFLHKGPLETLSESYHAIYGKWACDQSIVFRDARPFIKYIDPLNGQILPNQIETEIYIPIT